MNMIFFRSEDKYELTASFREVIVSSFQLELYSIYFTAGLYSVPHSNWTIAFVLGHKIDMTNYNCTGTIRLVSLWEGFSSRKGRGREKRCFEGHAKLNVKLSLLAGGITAWTHMGIEL